MGTGYPEGFLPQSTAIPYRLPAAPPDRPAETGPRRRVCGGLSPVCAICRHPAKPADGVEWSDSPPATWRRSGPRRAELSPAVAALALRSGAVSTAGYALGDLRPSGLGYRRTRGNTARRTLLTSVDHLRRTPRLGVSGPAPSTLGRGSRSDPGPTTLAGRRYFKSSRRKKN